MVFYNGYKGRFKYSKAKVKEFKELISNSNLTREEQNELYKTPMDYMLYTRVDEEMKIQIL